MIEFNTDAVVDTAWLAEHLDAPDVHVVDASYYLPHEGLSGREEFELQHIPGAVFFDIDEIADASSELPHMLPPPEKFSSRVRKLGLGDGVRVVVYDQRGIFSAPRVWWTFRYFGHEDVAVLDGGLPKWLAEGRPVEDGPAWPVERHFTARMNSFMPTPAASRGATRSRATDCAAAISRAASTCPSRSCSTPRARPSLRRSRSRRASRPRAST
jgi:thiosulfate/3-mercaptopyruvate sulfurtransferase